MINFLEVNIENFMSVGSAKVNLDNQGLVLIEGVNKDDPSARSNGAGKSSIVDAISWCLFGQTARGVSADGVVNVKTGKNTMVEIKVIVDSALYKIVRGRKHHALKNRVELWVFDDHDGTYTELTGGTDKITQEKIHDLFGCTVEVFNAAIYMGQEAMPDLPGMTDKTLKNILEQAIGIDRLDDALELCKERLSAAEYARDKEEETLEKFKDKLYNLESTKKNLDKDIEEIAAMIEESNLALSEKVKNSETEMFHLSVKINRLETRKADLKKESEKMKMDVTFDNELEQLEKKLETAYSNVEKKRQKNFLIKNEVAKLRKQISSLDEDHSCGECGRPYDESHIEDLEIRKKSLVEKLKEMEDQLKKGSFLIENLLSGIKSLTEEKTELLSKKSEANKDIIQLKESLVAYDDAINKLKSNIDSEKKSINAMAKFVEDRNAKQISSLEAKRRDRDKVIVDAKFLEKQIDGAKSILEEKKKNVENLEKVSYILGRKGFRGEILDQITPFLNIRTNHYLSQLTNDNITAAWDTIGYNSTGEIIESFHIDVSHVNGIKKFASLSGGERRKVRLACALALQDLISMRATKPIKLFIADEIDDAIDSAGLELLMSVLEQKAKDVGTVLIISHNDIGDWVRNKITITKQDGQSSFN